MCRKQFLISITILSFSGFLGGAISNYFLYEGVVAAQAASDKSETIEAAEEELAKRKEALEKKKEEVRGYLEKLIQKSLSSDLKARRKEYEKNLNIVKAEGFELVDKQGRSRGRFITDTNGDPYFQLIRKDESGNVKALVHLGFDEIDGQPFLRVADLSSKLSGALFASADMTPDNIRIGWVGDKPYISLSADNESAGIDVKDSHGRTLIESTSIAVTTSQARAILGPTMFYMEGPDGKTALTPAGSEGVSLAFWNRQGGTIWAAP